MIDPIAALFNRLNSRIKSLEREIEQLKSETVRQGDLIRALTGADRAKEGEAVSAKNAHTDAAMAKDPQL